MYKPWVGVDLDGTLAEDIDWSSGFVGVGKPIPKMVERVKTMLAEGKEVRIMTARVGINNRYSDVSKCMADRVFASLQNKLIQSWCIEHLGRALEVTCQKDFEMIALYDDRAIQMVPNTGTTLEEACHEHIAKELLFYA